MINIPKHVAIIMDGNGRWAQQHGQSRIYGHQNVSQSIAAVIKICLKKKIKYLSLYAFSTENWSRPVSEINGIFEIINKYIVENMHVCDEYNIKVNFLGDTHSLPEYLCSTIANIVSHTINYDRLIISVGLNYSGRWDIVNGINQLVKQKVDSVTVDDVSNVLSTHGIPDPDVLIRTGKEKRISNFFLWQIAYTELFFVDKFWPDFNEGDFMNILHGYSKRQRRFGGINNVNI